MAAGVAGLDLAAQSSLTGADAHGPVIRLSAPPGPVPAGSVVAVRIEVAAGGQPVDGVAAYLDFDPAILQVTDSAGNPLSTIEPGGPLALVLLNRVDHQAGTIDYAAGAQFNQPAPSGTLALATIYFVGRQASGGAPLTFVRRQPRLTEIVANGSSVFGAAEGLTLVVAPPAATPAGSATAIPAATATPPPAGTLQDRLYLPVVIDQRGQSGQSG